VYNGCKTIVVVVVVVVVDDDDDDVADVVVVAQYFCNFTFLHLLQLKPTG